MPICGDERLSRISRGSVHGAASGLLDGVYMKKKNDGREGPDAKVVRWLNLPFRSR